KLVTGVQTCALPISVNNVEHALNTPASDPIRAESKPATTRPRNPGGNRYCTIIGKAPWATEEIALPSAPIITPSAGTLPLFARRSEEHTSELQSLAY